MKVISTGKPDEYLVYSYLNTGAATIDLSVAGIPAQSGVDLVIILDASSSMGKCLHGKDVGERCNGVVVGGEGSCPIRMSVLENTLETVLTQLQTPVNGYTLYDHGASYQVTLSSNGNGTYTVTTADGIHTLTTYVVGVDETPVATEGTVSTTDYATVNTVVWFAVTAQVGCVPDVVVVDFGLSVDVDVMANDTMFGNLGKLTYVAKAESFQSFSDEPQFTSTTADGTVGFAAIHDGEAAPGYYHATLTVIPATTIYYEDNFLTYESYQFWRDENNAVQSMEITNKEGNSNYNPTLHSNHQWSIDGSTISATQAEDRPGEFSLDMIDANNIYGYDDAYVNMTRHSLGSAMKALCVAMLNYGAAAQEYFGYYAKNYFA